MNEEKKINKERKWMVKLKQFIWNLFPYTVEIFIRELLVPSFRQTRMVNNIHLRQNILKIENNKKIKIEKIKIVFFCQFPSMWNSCCTAFKAALNDPDIEVYLLTLPTRQIERKHCKDDLSYNYCQQFYPAAIEAFNHITQSWFDLKNLKPDYVFLSRPYDDELPPAYKSAILATYTKICYLPYAYCKMNWDCRQVYRYDFLDHVYAVFTENDRYYKLITQMYRRAVEAGWKKVNYVGYQRFDLLFNNIRNKVNGYQKTVLWLPRWTTRELLESSSFFRYKELLVKFFLRYPEYKLICRPHPLMFDNFISTGEMTNIEVAQFKRLFAETKNFVLDETADYLPAFAEADIFVSDVSSLLVEEFATGKPIIYCGTMSHFDRQAKRWAKLMYCGNNPNSLLDILRCLLDGSDPNKCAREHVIGYIMNCDGKCGERAINFIKKDYFKNIDNSKYR